MSGLLFLKYLTAALTVSIAFAGSWFYEYAKTDKETGKRSLTGVGKVACLAAVLSLICAGASTIWSDYESANSIDREKKAADAFRANLILLLKAIDTKFDAKTKQEFVGVVEKLKSDGPPATTPSETDARKDFDDYAARWKNESAGKVEKHVVDAAECQASKLQPLAKSTHRSAVITFTGTEGPAIVITLKEEGVDLKVSDVSKKTDLGEGYSFIFVDGTETPKLSCSVHKDDWTCHDATSRSPAARTAFQLLQSKLISKVKTNNSTYEIAPANAKDIQTTFACIKL